MEWIRKFYSNTFAVFKISRTNLFSSNNSGKKKSNIVNSTIKNICKSNKGKNRHIY